MENETKASAGTDDAKRTQGTPPTGAAENPDFLWKTINRFDFYINSTNTKANFIIAFNVFVLTALIIKWADAFPSNSEFVKLTIAAHVVLGVVSLCALASLYFVFQVINPFLKSPTTDTDRSLIYFGDVAKDAKHDAYLDRLKKADASIVVRDLGTQAHVLAQGTMGKFRNTKLAVGFIIYGMLPGLFVLLVSKVAMMLGG